VSGGKITAMNRTKTKKSRMTRVLFFTTSAVAILVGFPTLLANVLTRGEIFHLSKAPAAAVAIVFGAGLTRSGEPTPILRDRVATAADLYFSGKAQKLLLSGDNPTLYYNEPGAMRQYALDLGVPESDIILDYAGRRTYDTCYRAMHIFGVKDALIITQSYHLPRALLTCRGLGLKAVGVSADRQSYNARSMTRWRLREIPATLMAVWDVYVSRPLPVLGKPEPIFSTSQSIDQRN